MPLDLNRTCPKGHTTGRLASGRCIQCNRDVQRRFRLEHPDKDKKSQGDRYRRRRTIPLERAKSIVCAARIRAREKSIPFDIDVEWVLPKLLRGCCEVTGIPFVLTFETGRQQPFSPSLDRIDSDKGYLKGNCRMIVWALNCGLSNFGEVTYELVARAYLNSMDGRS